MIEIKEFTKDRIDDVIAFEHDLRREEGIWGWEIDDLMKKLGMPTIFCNELIVSPEGKITDYKLRQANGKYHAVKALQSIGFNTIASGDSFNDLAMIQASQAGFLFRAPEHIIKDNPQVQAFTEYDDLLAAIKKVVL